MNCAVCGRAFWSRGGAVTCSPECSKARKHEKALERGRRHYANNRDRVREKARRYKENNRERVLEIKQRSREKHWRKNVEYNRTYRRVKTRRKHAAIAQAELKMILEQGVLNYGT